jgi:hypothetical protein
VAKLHSKFLFEGLAEDVSGRVPESFLSLRSVEIEKLNLAVAFKGPGGIPLHPALVLRAAFNFGVDEAIVEGGNTSLRIAHLADNNLLSELLRNHFSDIKGWGLERFSLLHVTVRKSNSDLLNGKLRKFQKLFGKKSVKEVTTGLEECGIFDELVFPANFAVSSDIAASLSLGSLPFGSTMLRLVLSRSLFGLLEDDMLRIVASAFMMAGVKRVFYFTFCLFNKISRFHRDNKIKMTSIHLF